ncbi:hypothetical protein K490DRAFT_62633 [Saccharata proteae CBS 121410]|uniref:DUF7732 domain-containing protein n=1 Tax=Saccharata proteae CBS 121410 TaxID=1314787 RepID=A0A9P4HY08_9PEZI|nr:hypothetical protein K490DRAFT_62633 [Saccharata proteae CBS 121410]
MKVFYTLSLALSALGAASALSVPRDPNELAVRDADNVASSFERKVASLFDGPALEKRKGGGGHASSGGGGRSGSSGSSGSGSSGRTGSSGSSGSSSSGKGGSTSSSSNTGGRTSSGSGRTPSYGSGGRYYSGGASVPYSAGKRSPSASIAPILIGGAALAFLPALWLSSSYGAYNYHYPNPYTFHNSSAGANNTDNGNTTLPIDCFCGRFSTCGCDANNDTSYYQSLVGNGSYDALNKSVVDVATVNGTKTLLINGELPNGTTASGGTSAGSPSVMLQGMGWWSVVAVVCATIWFA